MLERLTGWLGGLLRRGRRGGAAHSGNADEQLETFRDALRAVSPDFDRYYKLAGDEAGEAAVRTAYAGLPAKGKVSRSAVVREFMVRLAEQAADDEDVETISGLSERQVTLAARRAGIPI